MAKSLLAFLWVTSLVCLVSARTLYIAEAVNRDGLGLAKWLKGVSLDVHGFYGDVVVASGVHKLPSHDLGVAIIHYTSDNFNSMSLYVLERQEGIEYDAPLYVQGENLSVLFSSYNRLVVSVSPNIPLYSLHLPIDIEIIPVDLHSSTHFGMRPEIEKLITEVYANANKRFLLAPDPLIEKLVSSVSPDALKGFVTYLTGENTQSTILTRNSRSTGAVTASKWIMERFQQFGLTASTETFRAEFSPNVIGIKTGATDPTKVVVVGAHYDSRGPDVNSQTQRAPGANDNGSGTGAVLHIAQIFNSLAVKFNFTIHFVVYSGEEQGLYGSAAYAQKLVADKVNVIGVFNADMIAYRKPGEATQCAFPSRYSTPQVESHAKAAVTTYVPSLVIGTTTACCSDHQSYYTRGIPATGFFERNGPIIDDQYHKSGDLVNRTGYDVTGQFTLLTQAVLASVATLAGAIASL